MLTQKLLHSMFIYDTASGIFYWKISRGGMLPGDIAGNLHSRGYCQIGVRGKIYKAHRLAWLYVYGVLPTKQIDHVNGIKTDNRIENLREVTAAENQHNQNRAQRENPYIGVCWHKRDKNWCAYINVNKKMKHLGSFDTAEEARAAYLSAKRIYHPTAPERCYE